MLISSLNAYYLSNDYILYIFFKFYFFYYLFIYVKIMNLFIK